MVAEQPSGEKCHCLSLRIRCTCLRKGLGLPGVRHSPCPARLAPSPPDTHNRALGGVRPPDPEHTPLIRRFSPESRAPESSGGAPDR
eukprot:14544279-Alexandrium_andersonii.AAC.1